MRKSTAATSEPPAEFRLAQERWTRVRQERRERAERLQAGRHAISMWRYAWGDDEPKPVRAIEQAAEFTASLGLRKPERPDVEAAVRQLEREARDADDAYEVEADAWQRALGVERRRQIDVVRPQLRERAHRIARLVEVLSAEIEAGRALVEPLRKLGGDPPDVGAEIGALVDWNSALSKWNRKMLELGIL